MPEIVAHDRAVPEVAEGATRFIVETPKHREVPVMLRLTLKSATLLGETATEWRRLVEQQVPSGSVDDRPTD